MAEEEVRKSLDQALQAIKNYQEKTLCSWCKSSAQKIAQATEDLRSLHEYGEKFVLELEKKKGLVELPEEAARLATLRALAEGRKVVTSELQESKSLFTKSIIPSRDELFGAILPTPAEVLELIRPPLPHEILTMMLGGKQLG